MGDGGIYSSYYTPSSLKMTRIDIMPCNVTIMFNVLLSHTVLATVDAGF